MYQNVGVEELVNKKDPTLVNENLHQISGHSIRRRDDLGTSDFITINLR